MLQLEEISHTQGGRINEKKKKVAGLFSEPQGLSKIEA